MSTFVTLSYVFESGVCSSFLAAESVVIWCCESGYCLFHVVVFVKTCGIFQHGNLK